MKNANEIRCHAHEIILQLHKAKEVGQIQLLYMACRLAIKDLDPELFARMLRDEKPELDAITKALDAYDAAIGYCNEYLCPCGNEWFSFSGLTQAETCPKCGAEVFPDSSEARHECVDGRCYDSATGATSCRPRWTAEVEGES